MIVLTCALAAQLRYSESPAKKVFLPNDSVVFVQSRPANFCTITLIVGCPSNPDTPQIYGYRHLIEHLVAKSVPGHDLAIESTGGKLDAETNRDWMRFQWRVNVEMLPAVNSAIQKFLDWRGTTAEEIQKESRLIGLERRLLSREQVTSIDGWKSVFAESGLDPMGTEESCKTATPEQLATLWKQMVKGGNVSIVAAGPLDVDRVSELFSQALRGLPKPPTRRWEPRSIQDSFGTSQGVGLVVPAMGSKGWAAGIVAAFALSSQIPQPYVSVTFSPRPIVALVGTSDPSVALKPILDEQDPAALFAVGKRFARRWIASQTDSADDVSGFEAILVNAGMSYAPSKLWDEIGTADYDDYLRHWRQAKAVVK